MNWGRWQQRLATIDVLFGAVLVAIALWYCLANSLNKGAFDQTTLADFAYNQECTQTIVHDGGYDNVFCPYPPPSILLRHGLGLLGYQPAAAIWIAMILASVVTSVALLLRMTGLDRSPHAWLWGLVGSLSVIYYLEWDCKSLNSNLMMLALILGSVANVERRPVLSGILLALATALKLYGVLFLPYLLLRGHRRALMSALVATAALFVIPTGLFWGLDGGIAITHSWLEMMRRASVFPNFNPVLVSLSKVMQETLTPRGGEVAVAAWDPSVVQWMTKSIHGLWLLGIVGYFGLASRQKSRDSRQRLSEASVLLLLPLMLTPILQPHQPAVALAAAFVLLAGAFDLTRPRWVRGLLLGTLVVSPLLLEFGPKHPFRGYGIALQLGLMLAALIVDQAVPSTRSTLSIPANKDKDRTTDGGFSRVFSDRRKAS